MRMGIALVILADLLIRAGDLSAHYSDAGMWPRQVLVNFGWKEGYWSLFLLSGSSAWALLLFGIQFLMALFLLVGYRTRLVTVLLWLLYISLHNRNLYLLQAGDDLLRLLLFWGIFLPWQNTWSIDQKQNRLAGPSSVAVLGYFFLLASVYFFAAVLKTDKDWYSEGSAVYYALSLDQMRLAPFGNWLYQFPGLMKAVTRLVLIIEFLVPLLILWPQKKGHLRLIAFLLVLLLQAGIGATLYVGLFFVISCVAVLGLLPGTLLDRVTQKQKQSAEAVAKSGSNFLHYTSRTLGIIVLIICLFTNLSSTSWFDYRLKKEGLLPVQIFRFDQYWGMFSPYVMRKDGWLVYYGIDSLGRQWDLRLNQDYVDFSKPDRVVSMYRTDRWRKLAENMQGQGLFLRPLYCKYILHKWNREHPEKQISTLNLYFMMKENLLNYKSTAPVKHLYCVCIDH